MDISVIVNICLSISSFLLAFISVVILVVTIRQNHLILESESRAYLSIYAETTDAHGVTLYLILKNFGKSNALITHWECDTDLAPFALIEGFVPFSHMEDASIAPNQSYKYALIQEYLKLSGIQSLNFSISYKCNKKSYSESICVSLPPLWDELHTNAPSKDETEIKTISRTLQDINRRML